MYCLTRRLLVHACAVCAVSFRGGEEADTFIMRQAREYKDTGVKKVSGRSRIWPALMLR